MIKAFIIVLFITEPVYCMFRPVHCMFRDALTSDQLRKPIIMQDIVTVKEHLSYYTLDEKKRNVALAQADDQIKKLSSWHKKRRVEDLIVDALQFYIGGFSLHYTLGFFLIGINKMARMESKEKSDNKYAAAIEIKKLIEDHKTMEKKIKVFQEYERQEDESFQKFVELLDSLDIIDEDDGTSTIVFKKTKPTF